MQNDTISLEQRVLQLAKIGVGKKRIARELGLTEWRVRKIVRQAEAGVLVAPCSRTKKRLFYDIETSYNIVKSWRIGYNCTINVDDIIKERAIICVCYKWEGEDTVYSLIWDKGDDRKLVEDFLKVLNEATEAVGHNIQEFDQKFILTRAAKHGISAHPKYVSYDTYQKAKRHFSFNSNKLDYISKFLGLSGKMQHEGLPMWDAIVLRNDRSALERMVEYCKADVLVTEAVFEKLRVLTEISTNHASELGKPLYNCPNCAGSNSSYLKPVISKAGVARRLMECLDCNQKYVISNTQYIDSLDNKKAKK